MKLFLLNYHPSEVLGRNQHELCYGAEVVVVRAETADAAAKMWKASLHEDDLPGFSGSPSVREITTEGSPELIAIVVGAG